MKRKKIEKKQVKKHFASNLISKTLFLDFTSLLKAVYFGA